MQFDIWRTKVMTSYSIKNETALRIGGFESTRL